MPLKRELALPKVCNFEGPFSTEFHNFMMIFFTQLYTIVCGAPGSVVARVSQVTVPSVTSWGLMSRVLCLATFFLRSLVKINKACFFALGLVQFHYWIEESCCFSLRDRKDSSKNWEDSHLSSPAAPAKPGMVPFAFQAPVFSQRLTLLHLHSASKSQARDSSVFVPSLKGRVGGRNPSLGKRSCLNCKQKPKRCERRRWQPEKNSENKWERRWWSRKQKGMPSKCSMWSDLARTLFDISHPQRCFKGGISDTPAWLRLINSVGMPLSNTFYHCRKKWSENCFLTRFKFRKFCVGVCVCHSTNTHICNL